MNRIKEYLIFAGIVIVVLNFTLIGKSMIFILLKIVSALQPLLIGLTIAYILDPLVEYIYNKACSKLPNSFFKTPAKEVKSKKAIRTGSILVTYGIILTGILLILYSMVTLIIGELAFQPFSKTLSTFFGYFENYQSMIRVWLSNLPDSIVTDKLEDLIGEFFAFFTQHISNQGLFHTVKSISGGILNVILGLIIGLYLLKDKTYFQHLWNNLLHITLSQNVHGHIRELLFDINSVMSTFVRGTIIDAAIVALLSSLVLTIEKVPFAVFIGCLTGIANVIPYFGPFFGIIPAFIVTLASDDLAKSILVIVSLTLIQQIDGNFIYPKIVGSSTVLHPLYVLLSISIAGYFNGIPGMILAVPIASILKLLYDKYVIKSI